MFRWRAPDLHVLAEKRVGGLQVLVQHLVQLGELALLVIALDPSGPSLARKPAESGSVQRIALGSQS
jgi:hypothetical protein